MTDKELAEIEERCSKATDGPWIATSLGKEAYVKHIYLDEMKRRCTCFPASCSATTLDNDFNADFIAHAREDVPKLIAEIRRLRVK